MMEFAFRLVFRARTVLAGMLFAEVMLQASVSAAQVTTSITSSGLGTVVTQNGTARDITGGTRPGNGANLFHSFGVFNIGEGSSANFLNNSGLPTSNILGRVTGGQTSSIFGTIRTTGFGTANLFLINPFGWIFGSTAFLDVGGSFHVSTADYVRLSDGVRFNAGPGPTDALLTSAPPAAFGFLGINPPASISVNGSFLQVPETQTLSLVGGDVQIVADAVTGGPSVLSAPSGRVQIGSFTSAGEAAVTDLNGSFATLGRVEISGLSSVDTAGVVSFDSDGNPLASNGGTILIRGGEIDISGAFLKASGAQILDPDFNPIGGSAGGTVVIRGGRLLVDSSSMVADTFGDVNGAPVGIDIQMADSVDLTNGSSLATSASGAGRGGDIQVAADQVKVDGSFVNTSTFGEGRAGDIVLADVARLSLTNFADMSSLNLSFGSGRAGDVIVTASELIDIASGSKLSNTTFFNGNGGHLTLSAPSLQLAGEGTGIVTSTTDIVGGGAPGNVAINVGELNIIDGAQLGSFASTVEHGGNLTIQAGSALISGTDAGGFASGIYSSNAGGGAAGDISLNVGRLSLMGGAVIESGNATDPQGGNVAISATESIVISDGSGVTLRAFSQDVGQLTVSGPTASLTIDNGFLSTSTSEAGRAGDIAVNVRTLDLTRGGQITSSSPAFASGAGGNVTIDAESISISGSSPSGAPSSPFSTDPRSGIFSTAAGTGPGGTIDIQSAQLLITDGGVVSANSTGSASATAGDINIIFSDTLRMENGSITTEALVADGGNISITSTGSLLHMTNSQITTSVQSGSGQGGNITIGSELHPLDFIVLNNGGIHANAFGGPGGSINIFADTLLSSLPLAIAVTASSALSTPGAIDIQATIVDVSGDISQLPEAPLQATELLRASCAARVAGGKSSSLTLGGRGGLPLEPGGLLPSALYASQASTINSGGRRFAAEETDLSDGQFSAFRAGGQRAQMPLGWNQFRLAKAALGFGCSQ
jgi:filamentous hemagglutinin family protein